MNDHLPDKFENAALPVHHQPPEPSSGFTGLVVPVLVNVPNPFVHVARIKLGQPARKNNIVLLYT